MSSLEKRTLGNPSPLRNFLAYPVGKAMHVCILSNVRTVASDSRASGIVLGCGHIKILTATRVMAAQDTLHTDGGRNALAPRLQEITNARFLSSLL